MSQQITYKDSGVDIEAGNALVEKIKPFAKASSGKGVMGSLGGFGGLFDLKACGFQDPILVSGTDGVGTKLLVAIETGRVNTIGQDLVAMCVNDVIVQGAKPLFFLDYFSTSRLDISQASQVIQGIAQACSDVGCALLGGETAEMPGFYASGHFDLAGFCVGAVERTHLLPKTQFSEGDVLIGVDSSGPHSNGYSLLRKIVEKAGLKWEDKAPWSPEVTVGEALLVPTSLYVNAALHLLTSVPVSAFCHITGGGISENVPRILPENMAVEIDLSAWNFPSWYQWAVSEASLSLEEALKTFNAGIGFVAVVPQAHQQETIDIFQSFGHGARVIGRVTAASEGTASHRVHYLGA